MSADGLDYNHELRARALALPEMDLRRAVDRLLEQCGREEVHHVPGSPRSGMLHTSEIYMVLGLRGPDLSALRNAIEQSGATIRHRCAHCGQPIESTGGHDWIGPVPQPGEPQKRYHLSTDFPECRRASGACGDGGEP